MEDDGFVLVRKRKATKKTLVKKSDGTHVRADGTLEDVRNAMNRVEKEFRESRLGDWLVSRIRTTILSNDRRRLGRIVVLGNGHFDSYHEPGAHQLALCRYVAAAFHITLVFQDPVITPSEREWLNTEKIEIRDSIDAKIDCGCVIAPTSSAMDRSSDSQEKFEEEKRETDESITLLFIIHGEHEILNEFICHNWSREKLKRVVIVGNDYGGVNWSLRMDKNDDSSRYISSWSAACLTTPFPSNYEPHDTAFSDTVIMYLNEDTIGKSVQEMEADWALLKL